MANGQKTKANGTTSNAGKTGEQNNQSGGASGQTSASGSGNLSEQVGNIVSGDTGAVKDVLNQAKESTTQVASQAYGIAAKKATSAIEEQKTTLAQGLTSVADNIRQLGENLKGDEQTSPIASVTAKYSDSIAGQVEQLSRYLEGKDLREMATDVERFARRNPAVFLGGAFVVGLLAARFLKTGNPNQSLMKRERYEREGVYLPDETEGIHLPENLDEMVSSKGGTQNAGTQNSSTGTGGSTETNLGSTK